MLHSAPSRDEKYKIAAERIWEAFFKEFEDAEPRGQKVIIAISGRSGSGKSSVAYYLCQCFMQHWKNKVKNVFQAEEGKWTRAERELSCEQIRLWERKKAVHLWVDDFYKENYMGLDPAGRKNRRKLRDYQGIGPDEYDWIEIGAILDAFKRNKKSRMPCVDLLNQQIDWLETDFSGCDVLVLDGLYAIDMSKQGLKADLSFFIEGEISTGPDPRDQETDNEERRIILAAEAKEIDNMKQYRINQRDLVALTWDEQRQDWEIRQYR